MTIRSDLTTQAVRSATLSKSVYQAAGAGRAYQSIAQSVAITVQDGTDYLRNALTVCGVGYGMAIAMAAAGDESGAKKLIQVCNLVAEGATTNYKAVGLAASKVLDAFA